MRRRRFLKASTRAGAAALLAASAGRIHGANDRVVIALIGCGGRGRSLARALRETPGVEYGAVCDVYDLQARRARRELGGRAEMYKDFRKVVERKDVDAVQIATPDHWHAIPAVLACRADKHVYVEKPLAHNILEGQAIVKAARGSKGVFLTGTQQRSAPHFAELSDIVRGGELQDVHLVRIWNYVNMTPDGIGSEPDSPAPEGLDWDFYLGPAPYVPFNRKRFLSTFRWFSDYAGGRITDLGVHRFDTVHQIMGVDAPRSVCAAGGRFAVKGMGDQPDVLQVTYEYPRFVLSYETASINAFGAVGRITPDATYYGARRGGEGRPNGMAFYGSNGTVIADRVGYEIIPEVREWSAHARRSPGEARPHQLQRRHRSSRDATALHCRHFIRCIREGEKPRCDAAVGHRSTLVAHLGNIAHKVGAKLRWDARKEDFIGGPEASSLLGRRARKPWDLISI